MLHDLGRHATLRRFAPQVEAVTGATLRDKPFNQAVESVQRGIIIERDSRALTGWRQWAAQITLFTLQQRGYQNARSFVYPVRHWLAIMGRTLPPSYLSESDRNRRPAVQSMPPALFATARAAAVALYA